MHLANGTLANDVCTATAALAAVAVAYAGQRAYYSANRARLARAAAGAAIVFAAQMIDVSLFNGMTVHVIGAAFLTLLAGPALAMLGMTAVIVTQALALGDGGVATLGANVLNMGVAAVVVSAWSARAVRGRTSGRRGFVAAALVSGAASVAAAIATMTVELALSGMPLGSVLSLTIPAHAPFAAWETATTLLLLLVAAYTRALEPLARTSSSS